VFDLTLSEIKAIELIYGNEGKGDLWDMKSITFQFFGKTKKSMVL